METIQNAIYTQPEWVQPKTLQNRFELRSAEHVFATLEFKKWYQYNGTAEAADGCWLFKHSGFFSTRVIIRKEGYDTDLGEYKPRWTGTQGTLTMSNGASYIWKPTNFWATQFAWLGADQQPFIFYKSGVENSGIKDWFKTQARVEIAPQAARIADLSLLVVLGWYLIILKQQESAAAAA